MYSIVYEYYDNATQSYEPDVIENFTSYYDALEYQLAHANLYPSYITHDD